MIWVMAVDGAELFLGNASGLDYLKPGCGLCCPPLCDGAAAAGLVS